MSKDGTNRGGARAGAGRKPKATAEKYANGNPGGRKLTVVEFEGATLEGCEMPEVKEYLKAKQKDGTYTCAEEIFKETWEWLCERKCEQLVTPQQIEQYAMSIARWIQCEEAVSQFGFLAKKPTGTVISSPYVIMGREYMKQANAAWFQIYQIVKENCSVEFKGPTPQDDAMERLLRARETHNITINSIEELRTRLDEMAKEFAGTNISATESKTTDTAYKNAFFEHLHTGLTSNVLKKGSDGAGGYLVPDTYEAELVQALRNKNLMRRLGTIISTTSNLKIPVVDAHGEAFWVEEGESYSFTNESFGQIEIDAYKLAVAILVSDEMLEDSGIDLEAYIKSSFADALGDAEEEAFLTGNGKGKPVGIIHQTEAALEVDTLSSITLDDVIDLEYSLKQPYRKNAVFIMSEEAYLHLRKIKTFNGKPAWKPSLTEDEP